MYHWLGFDGAGNKKLIAAWLFSRTGGWSKAEYHCGPCKAKNKHEKRNCSKFFPSLIQIDRAPCWRPAIESNQKRFLVGKRIFTECPTSYITAESIWILEQLDSNALAFRDAGACLFGANLGNHPAWWVDALGAVAQAKNDYEWAEYEAMKK